MSAGNPTFIVAVRDKDAQIHFLLVTLIVLSSPAAAQIPFYTDDADTTPKGKFHIEFFNEPDWLQRSSLPGQRLNNSNFTLNYGLTERIELGVKCAVHQNFQPAAT